MTKRIAVIPGDGIGVEVTREAMETVTEACATTGTKIDLQFFPYGADHYDVRDA